MPSPLHVRELGAGPPVLLVHGSFSWGEQAFSQQRELAGRLRLRIVDRRGYGRSPDTPRVDFEVDAADLVELAGAGSHLVGHSYGGVACLLAAARAPEAVHSLTVIEPPAFALARGHPAVDELVARVEAHFESGQGLSPGAFYAGFLRAWGLAVQEPEGLTPQAERAFRSSMTERGPWEADVPLERLRSAAIPTLVVRGAWTDPRPEARRIGAAAFAAVCDVLERALGAQALCVAEAAHRPQVAGAPFNEPLAAFVETAEARRGHP
jgi:pimeloyl-ACP methyl ester carboxylesterase